MNNHDADVTVLGSQTDRQCMTDGQHSPNDAVVNGNVANGATANEVGTMDELSVTSKGMCI